MQETPMLFPVTQVEFWKQMRAVIEEVLESKSKIKQQEPATTHLPEKPLLKLKDVCDIFQVSKPTLYEWIRQGKLKSFKVRSRRYFSRADIDAIIQQPRP
jgi:excisionase family DNA binding protein